MKKLLAALVLGGVLGFVQPVIAQEAPKEKSAVERVGDGIGDLFGRGLDYITRKLRERELEGEIESKFSYNLDDKNLEGFLAKKRYEVFESADVTNFTDNKAVAVLEYDFRSPEPGRYRNFRTRMQREFSLTDGSIDAVVSQGEDWGELCGRKVSEAVLNDFLLLNSAVADRWDKKVQDCAAQNKEHVFDYQIVFIAHNGDVYKRDSAEKSKVELPAKKSQAGISLTVKDKFGNVLQNQRFVEEYQNQGSWQYERELFNRSMSGFDFTEENHWNERDFLQQLGASADSAFREGVKYIKSLFQD